jgi:hypothetical protein
MKRLIASAVIAVPLVFAAFVSQANAGITIRLGDRQDNYGRDRDYRRDEYQLRRNSIYTTPNRNIRAIERRIERRTWIPAHWGYNNRGRVWVPGSYVYQ